MKKIYAMHVILDGKSHRPKVVYDLTDEMTFDDMLCTQQNHVTPFTALYNAIVSKTAIISVNVIINSITQNYFIVHSIMHVIFNQLLFVTLS